MLFSSAASRASAASPGVERPTLAHCEKRPNLPHPTTAGFNEFAAALAAVNTISTLDTLSSSVQGEEVLLGGWPASVCWGGVFV